MTAKFAMFWIGLCDIQYTLNLSLKVTWFFEKKQKTFHKYNKGTEDCMKRENTRMFRVKVFFIETKRVKMNAITFHTWLKFLFFFCQLPQANQLSLNYFAN